MLKVAVPAHRRNSHYPQGYSGDGALNNSRGAVTVTLDSSHSRP